MMVIYILVPVLMEMPLKLKSGEKIFTTAYDKRIFQCTPSLSLSLVAKT